MWVTLFRLIALNLLPCPAAALGRGILAAASRDLPQDLPLWGGYPAWRERKQRLLEGTNGAEIKNGKDREEEREAKVEIQILSGAGGRSQSVTQPLLCRC